MARALLPALHSIDSGLYGTGKELVGAGGLMGKQETPESVEQILGDLTGILDEAKQLTERIHGRL